MDSSFSCVVPIGTHPSGGSDTPPFVASSDSLSRSSSDDVRLVLATDDNDDDSSSSPVANTYTWPRDGIKSDCLSCLGLLSCRSSEEVLVVSGEPT